MKSFKEFMNEDGGAGGMGGSGGAPTTGTAGVAGAGDNPQKIVPVSRQRQKLHKIQAGLRKSVGGPGFK